MINVSPAFKTAMQDPIKRVTGYLTLQDGTDILPTGDLEKYTIETIGGSNTTGGLLKTTMRKCTIILLGSHLDLQGVSMDVFYGVEVTGAFEYALSGKFTVSEATFNRDENKTELIAYDNMQKFYIDYSAVAVFPTTLFGFLRAICSGAGVELENTTLYNGDLPIDEDYYTDIQDTKFRDVVEDIAEVSATQARILPSGNLYLAPINDTGEVITYENLLKYSTGDKWGSVNSIVLSRSPQNDNVFKQDEADINSPTNRNILDFNKFNETYSAGGA